MTVLSLHPAIKMNDVRGNKMDEGGRITLMIPLRDVQSCSLTAPSKANNNKNAYLGAISFLAVLSNGLSSAFIWILNCVEYPPAAA
jgi:hypothetical protein